VKKRRIYGSTSFFAKLADQNRIALEKMTPKQRAEYRVKVRLAFKLPPQPEPDLWKQ
jgi:hypothetical protein